MDESLKKIRIFVSSPSDVTNERAKVETVAESLKPMANYLGLTLEVVDWNEVVPDTGRPQQIIFDQLNPTSWDIFIGILWHRFGTPSGGMDPHTKRVYLSGTEEEFRTAYRLHKKFEKPHIVMYRCARAIPVDADLIQAQRVKEFFKEIQDPQGEFHVLTQSFDTTESFEKLVLNNLQKLLVEYGEESKTPITPEVGQVLAPKIPNNLPRQQAFFGRAKEMETVMRALSPADRTWGVLVDGIGGIGKSAIAIEASYRMQNAGLFEAFVFVTAKQNILDPSGIKELHPPARTLDEFLNETARVLGQPGIAKLADKEKRSALLDTLRVMCTLLIYDNLETLSKEEQEGIADFLRELPQGCKAIITSRRRGGEGGVWLRVEKLDWDAASGIIENEMARDAGLASKLNRVGKVRWQELFDETNGSPLALVHTLGLMRVRTALTFDGALKMLRGNRDEDLQKFIFQEAHKELTENDKSALGALSFFIPSASFEAWTQVAELSRNALETTIDRLSSLSLVDVMAGEERYALHPLTRAFVRRELLTEARVAREIGMRFVRYWADYAKRYGSSDKESYKTFNRLEDEWRNLDTTADWLWRRAHIDDGLVHDKDAAILIINLANAVRQFLLFGGRWDERVQINLHAYTAACAMQDWLNAVQCSHDLTLVYYDRAQTDNAALWAEHCADAWAGGRRKGDKSEAMRMRGLAAQMRKNYTEAEQLFQHALRITREPDSRVNPGEVLNNLGQLAQICKDWKSAKQHYIESLELAQRGEDNELITSRMGNLGTLELSCKQWSDAREWFEQEIELSKEIGQIDLIAQAQFGLACVHEAEGRTDLALRLAQGALKTYERLQHRNLAEVREFMERLEKQNN